MAGQVAVVTGAARGIGAAARHTLSQDGATIVAVDVQPPARPQRGTANRTGGTALQLDITAADAADRSFTHLSDRHGGVDLVVHNAGITGTSNRQHGPGAVGRAVLAVNLGIA
ncbi:SDR family NAD(P)-dependent oxidoreductase [Pseudonocardia sp. MCCB 268]|nr:SDR family NAD(P)-dependent oxidoreductase [Pseudonocardia cytotoxica]